MEKDRFININHLNNRSGILQLKMGNDNLEQASKKAFKLREDFRQKFTTISKKFNELCTEMDAMLTEIVGDKDAKNQSG